MKRLKEAPRASLARSKDNQVAVEVPKKKPKFFVKAPNRLLVPHRILQIQPVGQKKFVKIKGARRINFVKTMEVIRRLFYLVKATSANSSRIWIKSQPKIVQLQVNRVLL